MDKLEQKYQFSKLFKDNNIIEERDEDNI